MIIPSTKVLKHDSIKTFGCNYYYYFILIKNYFKLNYRHAYIYNNKLSLTAHETNSALTFSPRKMYVIRPAYPELCEKCDFQIIK